MFSLINLFYNEFKPWLFVAILMVSLSCSPSKKDNASTEGAKYSIGNSVILVRPEVQGGNEKTTFPGQLKPWFEAPMYAQVSGYVKHWHKDYGAYVKKGEVLAEILAPTVDADFSQAQAEWEAQRAKYDLADITEKRYTALRESNAVSEQSISVAKASQNAEKSIWNATKQQVKKQEVYLAFKKIRAPFDGVITERNINVGQYVNKEGNLSEGIGPQNLFTVADIHKLRLFVSVPNFYVSLLKPGLKVQVSLAQYPNRTFEASFGNYSRGYDAHTQTVLVQFILENKDLSIWPGSYATVRWSIENTNHSLRIPTSALVFDEGGTRVATLTDSNRIHFKDIEVGKVTDSFVDIKSGLNESDRVIKNPRASYLEEDIILDQIVDSFKDKGALNGKIKLEDSSSSKDSI